MVGVDEDIDLPLWRTPYLRSMTTYTACGEGRVAQDPKYKNWRWDGGDFDRNYAIVDANVDEYEVTLPSWLK